MLIEIQSLNANSMKNVQLNKPIIFCRKKKWLKNIKIENDLISIDYIDNSNNRFSVEIKNREIVD